MRGCDHVYPAAVTSSRDAKPPSELEALRHENELLRLNLRVTLEKIKALEGEVSALQTRAKANTAAVGGFTLDVTYPDVVYTKDLKKALEKALQPAEMESALKIFREAKDAASRRQALSHMEQAMRKLREEVRLPAD